MSDNALVCADGSARYGIFDETPDVINIDDFDYRNPMGGRQNPLRKVLGRKHFQYIGVISDDILLGVALGDFKYLGMAFAYTYEPRTERLTEFSMKIPLAVGFSLTNRPIDGTSEVNVGGNHIRMSGTREPRAVQLVVELTNGIAADVQFRLDRPWPFEPMAVNTQTAINGWVFTQKIAGVPAVGTISGPSGARNLSDLNAYAHYDYSLGFMRRETFWNWACFAGEADGQAVGLNLSCGVNETSYSENCFWIDGRRYDTGLAAFDYDRRAPDRKPWRVTTRDGSVDLEFTPEGMHREKLNVGLIASNFKQVFGRFNGTIKPAGADSVDIVEQYGFMEDQYAKW